MSFDKTSETDTIPSFSMESVFLDAGEEIFQECSHSLKSASPLTRGNP